MSKQKIYLYFFLKKKEAMKASNSKHILIVDDSATNLALVRGVLSEEGYQVDGAQDSAKALELCDRVHFDLIFVDLMMPRVDGFKLIKILKEDNNLKHIPIVIVSARTDREAYEQARQLQVEGYLPKPLRIQELVDKTHKILD